MSSLAEVVQQGRRSSRPSCSTSHPSTTAAPATRGPSSRARPRRPRRSCCTGAPRTSTASTSGARRPITNSPTWTTWTPAVAQLWALLDWQQVATPIPAIGYIGQRVRSARRKVDQPAGRPEGKPRALIWPVHARHLRPSGRLPLPPRPAIPHTSGYRLPADGLHQNRPPGEGRRPRSVWLPAPSLFVGRRLRLDAVNRRLDQQTRLHLLELFQVGRVGLDAQLPHALRMLLDELAQQLLMPGGDRRARRLGLVCVGGFGGRLRIETEECAVVGPLEAMDLCLQPAEADLGS